MKLQEAFMEAFVRAKMPKEAALYSTPAHNYCGEHQVFFSPLAGQIIGPHLLGRTLLDCDPPDVQSLAVLVKAE
jgi:hypothetical protein